MTVRSTVPTLPTLRRAALAFAMALLLQAAAPMLASWAAGMRDLDVADVCRVYGVATAGRASDDGRPAPADGALPGDIACALAASGSAAPPPTATSQATPPRTARSDDGPAAAPLRCDACARWIARLQHAPPTAG